MWKKRYNKQKGAEIKKKKKKIRRRPKPKFAPINKRVSLGKKNTLLESSDTQFSPFPFLIFLFLSFTPSLIVKPS